MAAGRFQRRRRPGTCPWTAISGARVGSGSTVKEDISTRLFPKSAQANSSRSPTAKRPLATARGGNGGSEAKRTRRSRYRLPYRQGHATRRVTVIVQPRNFPVPPDPVGKNPKVGGYSPTIGLRDIGLRKELSHAQRHEVGLRGMAAGEGRVTWYRNRWE